MNLKNLQWAYCENEFRHITGASKDENYFLDKLNKIALIYCKGEINKPYWRKEPNVHDDLIKKHFGTSESIEHYNTKMYFTQHKQVEYEENIIKAEFSESEYYINRISKRVDVMFFDVNKEPLLGVEVYKTNKKTNEDINKFEKINFPIYEYNYNTKKGEFISFGGNGIKQIESIKRKINNVNGLINGYKRRINGANRHIPILRKRVDLEKKKYFEEKEEIEYIEREIETFGNHFSIVEQIKKIEGQIIGSGNTIETEKEIYIWERKWNNNRDFEITSQSNYTKQKSIDGQ